MKPTIINALYFFSTSLFLRIDPSQPSDAIRVYFDNTESDEQITAAFAAEADTSYSFPERNIMNRDVGLFLQKTSVVILDFLLTVKDCSSVRHFLCPYILRFQYKNLNHETIFSIITQFLKYYL